MPAIRPSKENESVQMQEVHVVMVTNGEHVDQETLPVLVCASRSAAEEFVAECRDWARRNGVLRGAEDAMVDFGALRRLSGQCPGRPVYRSSWTIDYKAGVEWSVLPLPQRSPSKRVRTEAREQALRRLALCQQLLEDNLPPEAAAPLTLEEAGAIATELEQARAAVREAMGWNWLEENADSTIPQSVWELCEEAGGVPLCDRVTGIPGSSTTESPAD